jgi:hypothetical protein
MFGWAITDLSGRVIRRVWEKLEEPCFMGLFRNADPGDPLRFEKAVLDDWMRNNLQACGLPQGPPRNAGHGKGVRRQGRQAPHLWYAAVILRTMPSPLVIRYRSPVRSSYPMRRCARSRWDNALTPVRAPSRTMFRS